MTAEQAVETPAEAEVEQPSRLAGGCVLAIAAAAAGGAVYAVPELGYTVAGLCAATVYRRARGWLAGRSETAEQPDEAEPVDVVAVLHELSAGRTGHVRLTQLQEATGLPDTKAVRALLDEAGVPVRSGVRAGGKNGPGVHTDDIPPLSAPHEAGCLCRSGANTNANNGPGGGPGEELRVEAIGHAGTLVRDPADAYRHETITR